MHTENDFIGRHGIDDPDTEVIDHKISPVQYMPPDMIASAPRNFDYNNRMITIANISEKYRF